MTDIRRVAAVLAVEEHLTAQGHIDLNEVAVGDIVDVILSTFPQTTAGQLVAIRLASPPEGEQDHKLFNDIALLLSDIGLRPVFLVADNADLTVVPDPEDAWRATWSTDAAARVMELADQLRKEGQRESDPSSEHAHHVAAERLVELIPHLTDLARK